MPYKIRKEISFEAAHFIEGHKNPFTGEPGKCANLHGHSYKIAVCVKSNRVNYETGFVLDYYYLGDFLKEMHRTFDHRNLNDMHCFTIPYKSTAERIAEVVGMKFLAFMEEHTSPNDCRNAKLVYTECSETATTWARYYPPKKKAKA